MQNVISDFEDRVIEIELYFEFIQQMYKTNAQIYQPRARKNKYVVINPELLKILKANSFLLLYNLVESSMLNGILAIYNELETKNYTYEKVREEIRSIWINFHYDNVYDRSSNFDSYVKQAAKLVDMAINRTTIKLNRKAVPISGNLDADEIRLICNLHGIDNRVKAASAKGGGRLSIVKAQRNALAHGSLSFAECGKAFSIEDLIAIKKQVIIFVRGILSNMKKYIENEYYDSEKISRAR